MQTLLTRLTLLIISVALLASCGGTPASGIDTQTATPGLAALVEPTSTSVPAKADTPISLQSTATAEPAAATELPAVVAADPTATATSGPQAGQATMIFFTAPG